MDTCTRQLTASTKLVTRFMLIVLVVSAALLVFAREVNACSFTPPGSPTAELQQSTYVFAGKVIAVYPVPNDNIYQFKVYTVWKGSLYETFYLAGRENSYAGTSCAGSYQSFTVGLEYLVYDAYHIAGRTDLLVNASQDIAELGEGQRPIPGSSAPVPPAVSEARASAQTALSETRTVDEFIRFLGWPLVCVFSDDNCWPAAVNTDSISPMERDGQ